MTSVLDEARRATVPRVAGSASAALGLFVLVGWSLGIAWIKSVQPGAVEMKVNTAIGLLLSGISLCLLDGQQSLRRRRQGQLLGIIVAFLGIATAAEYAFGWRLGVDELLFRDTTNACNPVPGRMSPYCTVAFVATGLGLAALPYRSARTFAQAAAALTLLNGGCRSAGIPGTPARSSQSITFRRSRSTLRPHSPFWELVFSWQLARLPGPIEGRRPRSRSSRGALSRDFWPHSAFSY